MLRSPFTRRAALAAAAGAALLMSGCVVAPIGPAYGGEVVVGEAPPPERYEVVPAAPAVGYIWIGGYWNWVGARWAWVPGYWHAPRPGYRWVPHRWEPYGRGYRHGGGQWVR